MKNKLCFFLLCFSLMSIAGCVHTGRLYPVRGPLSAQTPAPVLFAKVHGVTSGNISVVLINGEVCQGRWALVHRAQPAGGGATASDAANDISSAWDTVYGPGFYIANVLGSKFHARALLSGSRGTVMNVEMYLPPDAGEKAGPSAIQGVAQDNHDNVYKLAF